MASTVNTKIIISAYMDSSFGKAMKQLSEAATIPLSIGRNLMPVTAALTKFGKESLETYADFDDAMRTVEGKLGDATTAEMDALRTQAREWARTTRYHATDVGAALAEAAGAGWTLEEMYSGMPAVLSMAAGGNMELSTALSYLSTAIAGMNLDFSESGQLVDEWMKTASSSRATAADLGESLQVLGSMATFADSKEEMFTLLAMMAEYGTTGSEAGTLLRNVMMRVVAPTKNAKEAMESLGITESELAESISEDGYDMGEAAQAMASMGFSAYTAEGQLKPFTQIISELRDATGDMTEQQRYNVLSKIFPQRSIKGILDLLRATDDEYAEMMARISSSEGYADYMAELQEGGVGGSMRRLESQWEELKIAVGEQLAPIAMDAIGAIGSVLDSISGLDRGALNVLTRSLMGLAGVAPALIGIGGAMKLVAMLGTTGGQLTLAAAAVGLIAGAIDGLIDNMEQLEREHFEANFGTAKLDTSMLEASLSAIEADFAAASSAVSGYVAAVQAGASTYISTTESLTGGLWSAVATGLTLTPAQEEQLLGYGEKLYSTLMKGARDSVDADLETLKFLSGGITEGEIIDSDSVVGTMGSLLLSAYDEITAAVQEKSDALREAMKSAFSGDHIVDQEEFQNIMKQMEELRSYASAVFSSESSAEFDDMVRQAQSVGVEGIEDFLDRTAESRERQQQNLERDMSSEYRSIMSKFRLAQEMGWEFFDPVSGQMVNAADLGDDWVNEFNEWFNTQTQAKQREIETRYGETTLRGMDAALLTSGFKDDWNELAGLVGTEGFDSTQAWLQYGDMGEGSGTLKDMVTFAQTVVEGLGGAQAVEQMASWLEESGNTAAAARYRQYLGIAGIDTSYETQQAAQAEYERQRQTKEDQTAAAAAEEIVSGAAEEVTTPEGGVDLADAPGKLVSGVAATIGDVGEALGGIADNVAPTLQRIWEDFTGGEDGEGIPESKWEADIAKQVALENAEEAAQAAKDAAEAAEMAEGPSLGEAVLDALIPGAAAEEAIPTGTGGTEMTATQDERDAHAATRAALEGAETGQGHVASWGEDIWEDVPLEEATPMDPALMALSAREMREEMAEEYHSRVVVDAEAGSGGAEAGSELAQQAQATADSDPVDVPVNEPEPPEIVVEDPEPVDVPVEVDMSGFNGTQAIDDWLNSLKPAQMQVTVPLGSADGNKYSTDFGAALFPGFQDVNTSDGGSAGSSWASGFQAALDANPGSYKVTVTAAGNTALLEKASSAANMQTYAEGGRAEEASIFGEAGAEWAIPEEHTQNTASLLMRAAAASGFTWPELITAAANRSGQASQNAANTLTYSPTFIINTDRAEEVEDILRRDRENMKRWWNETRLMEYRLAY